MVYTLNVSLFDVIGLVLALLITGAMLGWKLLPPPIDDKKEKLIDDLFQENMKLKVVQILKKK